VRERLYRSRSDRMLFGVAGGMAEWLDVDPSVVRLVWALLILAGGVGLLFYIIAAIVVPEEPIGSASTAPGGDPAGAAMGASAAAPGTAPALDQTRWEARQARRAARRAGRGNGGVIVGVLLVLVGAWFLLQRFLPAFDSSLVFPGVLILLGVALLVGAVGRSGDQGRG